MTVPGCPEIEYTITLLPGSGVLTSCTITDPGSSGLGHHRPKGQGHEQPGRECSSDQR